MTVSASPFCERVHRAALADHASASSPCTSCTGARPVITSTPSASQSVNGECHCSIVHALTDTPRFYNVILYQVLLSVLIGAVVGYLARIGLKYAERRK